MGSFLSSVISISLVLLLVGVVSLLIVNAKGVSDFFKENVKISVMMKQNVSLEETETFKRVLDGERYIKSSEVISAEQGAADMAALLGEDFLSVFETSPIPVSVEVSLKADYVSVDSLMMIQNHLMEMAQVDEVSYQTSLVDALNSNMNRISAVLAVFIALLLFISFAIVIIVL